MRNLTPETTHLLYRYESVPQIVTLLTVADPAQVNIIIKQLSPLGYRLSLVLDALATDVTTSASASDASTPVVSAVIDAVLDMGVAQDLGMLASTLSRLSPAQRKRLLSPRHDPNTLADIASLVDFSTLTADELALFTYSPSIDVRAAFVARNDVPLDDRITAMIGRLSPGVTTRFSDELPVFYRDLGAPVEPSAKTIPHDFALWSLSTAQMNRLSTSAISAVIAETASSASTTRQLGNLAAGFYECAYHTALLGHRTSPPYMTPTLHYAARMLRTAISRFRSAPPGVDEALVALRYALARFSKKPRNHADLADIFSPSYSEKFFSAVDVLVTSSYSLNAVAASALPDFAKMRVLEIADWIKQHGTDPWIPDCAIDPLLTLAVDALPPAAIEDIVRHLPPARIINALETLAPLNLRPWRDDLPTLFSLDEVAHVISVPQMFFFPPDQVRAYLDAAGVRPSDVVSIDAAVTGLTPATVVAVTR